jgi:heme/copper-type cytochrome/quinol oxidase subunit 2
MRGDVIVDTPEDYAAWMKEQAADKAGSADASEVQPTAAEKKS